MDIIEILFGFEGRIIRLPYIGYSIVSMLAMFAMFIASAPMLAASSSAFSLAIGFFTLTAGAGIGAWTTMALTAKRLHDLDWSGKHVISVYAVHLSASFAHTGSVLAVVCTTASIMIALWLAFWPGTDGPNHFG
ncbi:MAG: DUF805 domain-containing protein [Oxalobacteraceae bacterium]|nr:MAG: DUF805 domain-containing protein [Oxalobacteraceae bacterium]